MGAQGGVPIPELYVGRIVLADPSQGAQGGDVVLQARGGLLQSSGSIAGDTVLGGPMNVYHEQNVPATVSVTAIHADITLGVGGATTTGIINPVVPCVPQIKGTGAGATGNVVLAGTNVDDAPITDTIVLAGAAAVDAAKVFKTITSITVPADSGATGEKVSIGNTKKIGLRHNLTYAVMIKSLFDNAVDAGTLVIDNDEVEKNWYAVAGTPNGAKVLDLFYLVS